MNFAKFRTKILICLSFLILTSLSISFGSYVIANLTINGDNTINIESSEDTSNYHKIEFRDGDTNLKTMYVKDGEKITFEDIPTGHQEAKFEWISNDGNPNNNFSLKNNSFSSGLIVTKDLILTKNDILANQGTTTPNKNNFVDDPNDKGDSVVSTGNGTVVINQGDNKGSVITMDEPILNNVDFDINFKTIDKNGNESSQNIWQDLGNNGKTQHSTDKTIGLEDPYSTPDIYKPKAGGSSSLNPLVTRVKLASDTFLTGQSWIGVGARTGFYGESGWSQFNYQGLINGSYCELDLNGKTLVIGNGATLELRGSLIDSSPNKTGQVIVENGGTVKATFVIEDHYHERTIPIAYAYGDAPFKMYRMPYLNVKLVLRKGSSLIGYLRLDMGGDSGTNYYDGEVKIIGEGEGNVFDTSKNSIDSYIVREPVFDNFRFPESENQKNIYNTETETINSIVYEKFNYKFYNCDGLAFNTLWIGNIPYDAKIAKLNFSILWDRCDFFIPPYFSAYFYNSHVTIKNNIVFLPGSYLYMDSKSSITLSANSSNASDLYDVTSGSGTLIGWMLSDKMKDKKKYQSIGGLMFINERSYWSDAWSGWVEGNRGEGDALSQNIIIFNSTRKFWKYLNDNFPAYADIYGKIYFDNNVSLFKEKFHLGGLINIYDLSAFKQNLLGDDKVALFNSVFSSVGCNFNLTGKAYFNTDFYSVLPLISNGNVLTDMSSSWLRQDYDTIKFTFDLDSGLIVTNNSQKYAFTYVNNAGVYNNWNNFLNKSQCGDISDQEFMNKEDDLDVKFFKVISDENNVITMNVPMYEGDISNYQFIYFRGSFFRYSNGKVDIFKFKGENPGSNNNGWSDSYTIDVEFKNTDNYYNNNRWMIK